VVSPLISYFYSNIFLGYPSGFFHHYPDAESFKFNYYVFPFLQLIYMFFNFTAFNAIAISKYIYEHFEKILKDIVLIGTLIAFCSLFALFVKDVIILLPSFIQNKTYYDFRSSGLSQEPSFYILYQAWICLIGGYTRHLFKKNIWYLIMAINILSLLLTFSTAMFGFALILASSIFLFKTSFKIKMGIVITIAILLILGYLALLYFDLYPVFEYIFVSKLSGFFSVPETTTDSGSYRSYTSSIGIKIFKDHWVTGVGVGNSIYYMYIYEFKMGIREFGEMLSPGTFPQNSFSSVLADQGVIGGLSFLAFLGGALRKFWTNRNKSRYNQMFLLGTLFNFLAMLSIAPTYSLYLWVFIALGLCFIKYFNVEQSNISGMASKLT
ncbi:O-antigen ligase family protein, partial [Mucilaginibacter sp. Mucisp84]|uniref:O-antigen ligase family protein n=1 Tax=Mucilaginibacter sp. Mucisp84 TaxID=3243058 RepID=UPI0039A622D1